MPDIDTQEFLANVKAVLDEPTMADAIGNILETPFPASVEPFGIAVGQVGNIVGSVVFRVAMVAQEQGEPATRETMDSATSEAVEHIGKEMAAASCGAPLSGEQIQAIEICAVDYLARSLKDLPGFAEAG